MIEIEERHSKNNLDDSISYINSLGYKPHCLKNKELVSLNKIDDLSSFKNFGRDSDSFFVGITNVKLFILIKIFIINKNVLKTISKFHFYFTLLNKIFRHKITTYIIYAIIFNY